MNPQNIDPILRLPQVRQIVGLGRTKIYQLIKAGAFPAPVDLGGRAVGWKASEIQAWIDSRPKVRKEG